MYPGIQLYSTELVLIPLRLVLDTFVYIFSNFYFIFFFSLLSLKIPDVTERFRQGSVGETRASNLVFTIWAVFGGFILHFLLSNYLSVLLKPSYEIPVETTADLIKRDITPVVTPGGDIFVQLFAASSDPNYQEVSKRLVIPDDWDEYADVVRKVTSTGLFATLGTFPNWPVIEDQFHEWYRSSETITGLSVYGIHLTNKKWPLKKVL